MLKFVFAAFIFSIAPISRVAMAGLDDPPANSRERIEQIWAVIFTNDAGVDTIVQARLGSGQIVPLIATNQERLVQIMDAAKAIVHENLVKLRLVKFTHRVDVGEIGP